MPKMTKQQREVLQTSILKKLAKTLNKKYVDVLTRHSMQVHTEYYYGNKIPQKLRMRDSSATTQVSPLRDIRNTLVKAGQIFIVVKDDGRAVIEESSVAKNIIRVYHAELDCVEKDMDKIANMMQEEFLLKTSFSDIDDINEFIQEFTSKFK